MHLEFDSSLWSNEWSFFVNICVCLKRSYSLFVDYKVLYINYIIQITLFLVLSIWCLNFLEKCVKFSYCSCDLHKSWFFYCTFISFFLYFDPLFISTERFITVISSWWSVLSFYQNNVSLFVSELFLPWTYIFDLFLISAH